MFKIMLKLCFLINLFINKILTYQKQYSITLFYNWTLTMAFIIVHASILIMPRNTISTAQTAAV